ncbi:MAG: hypothetical protein COB15_03330 [Flavobacteriales bacterium]|nr:MAG: hypothetical protein COB15_03330 [Flavobacteriales bacterium]
MPIRRKVPQRYRDYYKTLKYMLDGSCLFNRMSDVGGYYYPYILKSYEDKIDIINSPNRILKSIEDYFKDNLLNKEEQILLLELIEGDVKSFGTSRVSDLNKKIDFYKRFSDSPKLDQSLVLEFHKSINAILEIRKVLEEKYWKYLEELKPNPKQSKITENDTMLSFKFKHRLNKDKVQKLNELLISLCLKVELLNEDKTSTEDLLDVLLSQDLMKESTHIYMGCSNVTFRYILDKLKPEFHNLSLSYIEKSNIFFSKGGTKMTSQNLYSSKQSDFAHKEQIDKTFSSFL